MSDWPMDPSELSEDHHEALYRLAGAVWKGDVTIAKRHRDRALVLVYETSDGGWQGNLATDGRLWIRKAKREYYFTYSTHYRIIMELDAPRRSPEQEDVA